MRNRKILAALGLAGCLLALVAAGCGGVSGSPGVANLAGTAGTTTSTTSTPSDAGTSQAGPSRPGGNFTLAMQLPGRDGVKFSACMRKHGVPNFPDPDSQGSSPSTRDPASIRCRPSSGPPSRLARRCCPTAVGRPRGSKRSNYGLRPPSLPACASTASRTSPTRAARAGSPSVPAPESTRTHRRSRLPRRPAGACSVTRADQ